MRFKCPKCERVFKEVRLFPLRCSCGKTSLPTDSLPIDGDEPQSPTLLKKVVTFGKALKEWAIAGFPLRTTEQIEEIKVICSGCEFSNGQGGCTKCGCSLARKQQMATAHCPVEKW